MMMRNQTWAPQTFERDNHQWTSITCFSPNKLLDAINVVREKLGRMYAGIVFSAVLVLPSAEAFAFTDGWMPGDGSFLDDPQKGLAMDFRKDMAAPEAYRAQLSNDVEHVARVVRRGGISWLTVDGKAVPPVLFKGHSAGGAGNPFSGRIMSEAGVPILVANVGLRDSPWFPSSPWTRDGFDAKAVVDRALRHMLTSTNALWMLTLRVDPPMDYVSWHTNEAWRVADGGIVYGNGVHAQRTQSDLVPRDLKLPPAKQTWPWVSMYSRVWRDELKRNLSAFIAELRASGFAKRIVGIHLGGFHDAQFATAYPDHSPAAKAAFAASGETDYNRFLKFGPQRLCDELAAHVKSCFGKDIVVLRWCMGAFGGSYCSSHDIGEFLKSEHVDGLVPQASYELREPGRPFGSILPHSSFHAHGKLLVHEFDLYPWIIRDPGRPKWFDRMVSRGKNPDEWRTIHRKLAGAMIARRTGWWYFDMGGGWYSPPEISSDIRAAMADVRRLFRPRETEWHPDAALLIDAENLLALQDPADCKAPKTRIQKIVEEIARSGVPFDSYLLEDFERDPSLAGRYKAVFRYDRDTPVLSTTEIRRRVGEAGGYMPVPAATVEVDMNGDFLSVHAIWDCKTDFVLPFDCRVVNLKSGREEKVVGGKLPLEMKRGETCWFGLSARSRAIPYDGPDWPDVTPEFDADAERFTAPAPKAVRTFDVPIRSEVRKVNGTPQLLVNGEALPLFWSCVNAGVRKDGLPRPADLPFNVCTVNNFYPRGIFPSTGKVDFNYVTKVADKFVETHPNAYLVWDICVAPPKDWAKAHPDDLCRDDRGEATSDGLQVNWSLGSDDAVRVMADQVAQVVAWVEKSKYASRVIAYRVNGGHTTEWLAWQAASGRAVDFSPAALAAFRDFAAKRYGPSFAEARIPTAEERRAADGRRLIWNPSDHLAVVAYHEFLSERQADILIRLCRVAKKTLEGRKAVGTYYGYTATLFADGNSQAQPHFALKKVLDSGAVDFLCSPQDYRIRTLGEPVLDMKPFGSIASCGLLSVIEDDTRTHCGRCLHGRGFGQTLTAFQSASLLRRNMGSYLCRGQPLYYYDLIHGTGFNFPEAKRDAEALRRVQELCAREGVARHAEIAVVVSESAVTAMPRIPVDMPGGQVIPEYGDDGRAKGVVRPRRLLSGELATLDLSRLSRIGAPWDCLLAEDLADNPGDYKLYVFLGCFRADARFRAAVKKLQTRACTLLWTYAPGYVDGIDGAVANMETLTGFSFRELPGKQTPAVVFENGEGTMGTPGVKASPLFEVSNADKILARYVDGGEPAVVRKKTGEATSVYSGVWLYSLDFLRSLAERSGVHSYVETDDPVEANDALFLLHARTAGLKRVTLPRKVAAVTDVFTGKVVGRDCDSFEFQSPLHGTRLFHFKDEKQGRKNHD